MNGINRIERFLNGNRIWGCEKPSNTVLKQLISVGNLTTIMGHLNMLRVRNGDILWIQLGYDAIYSTAENMRIGFVKRLGKAQNDNSIGKNLWWKWGNPNTRFSDKPVSRIHSTCKPINFSKIGHN